MKKYNLYLNNRRINTKPLSAEELATVRARKTIKYAPDGNATDKDRMVTIETNQLVIKQVIVF